MAVRTFGPISPEKTAGPVCALSHARLEQALTEESRLLIAEIGKNRSGESDKRFIRDAEISVTSHHFWHHASRHIETFQQLIIPIQSVNVEHHRATRIARFGNMPMIGCEIPDQPRVDRAES